MHQDVHKNTPGASVFTKYISYSHVAETIPV